MNIIRGFHVIFISFLVLSCSTDSGDGDTGTGGSMARFAVKNNYLYAVDYEDLNTFDISEPSSIRHVSEQYLGFGIETIFPTEENLFIGASNGMYIYGLSNPDMPSRLSFTPHFFSYDPVVVQGNFAYVTLRTRDQFVTETGQLLILDISNVQAPAQLARYDMVDPKGLAVKGDTLYICDDVFKLFRISNGYELAFIAAFDIPAIDVIAKDDILYIVAEDGLYQYYVEGATIEMLSKISMPVHEK